ncbi:AAA family ATPase [Micromonospora sp. NPDC049051]|uniref:AAA family ATPase n=1 Tax=Micromonospora sp. NPDC049051 TaxID=3364264 RepID=UPI0037185879
MRQIRQFTVEGLFDSALTHKIDFSQDGRVTIIAGPNGVGKTHILRLIHAILGLQITTLSRMPFQLARLKFADGRSLTARRLVGSNPRESRLLLEGNGARGRKLGLVEFPAEINIESELERFIPRSDGRFIDRRTGRILQGRDVEEYASFYRMRHSHARRRAMGEEQAALFSEEVISNSDWLADLIENRNPIFIDTKRLDTPQMKGGPDGPPSSRPRIDEYIEQVKVQVADARRGSLAVTQETDQTFAKRVLTPSKKSKPIREEDLKRRYEDIAEQSAELYRSGLSQTLVDVQFPSSTVDSTETRVLSIFIDDWQRKLEPLLPVNDKLKALQRIVNDKFIGKKLRLDKTGALVFVADDDQSLIPVTLLSSGEQHILALFTMLLFSAQPGSVVLIDEPEISLHAAWKHAFLEDITDVANIADLQIILATHSSGIINGRWDLVQELGTRR